MGRLTVFYPKWMNIAIDTYTGICNLFCSDEIVACREELEGYSQTPYGQYILENVTVWKEK